MRYFPVRGTVILALLLNLIILSQSITPVVRADAPCGTWSITGIEDQGSDSTQNPSSRLQAALTNPSTGCTSTFTFTNNTQFALPPKIQLFVGELGGYTLDVHVNSAQGGTYDWGDQSDGIVLTKILSHDLTVSTSTPANAADIDISGSFSTNGLLADTAVYLLQSLLAAIPAPDACVPSPGDIVIVALQAQQHFADLAGLLTNFNVLDPQHLNLDPIQQAFSNQLDGFITDAANFAEQTGRGCIAKGLKTFLKTIGVDISKKVAYVAGRVTDFSLWMGKWYVDYFANNRNPDVRLHYTPAQTTASISPGGTWISPNDGDSVSGVATHLAAHAYAGRSVRQVNFTAWWPSLGQNAAWKTVCPLLAPTHDDVFECDWNVSGVPTGDILVSFDVTDTTNSMIPSPNGIHTLHYTASSSQGTTNTTAPAPAPDPFTFFPPQTGQGCTLGAIVRCPGVQPTSAPQPPITPSPSPPPVSTPQTSPAQFYTPSSAWISPNNGGTYAVGSTIHFAVHASSKWGIQIVDFTIRKDGVDPDAWPSLCAAGPPGGGSDVFACDWQVPSDVSPGNVQLGFNILDNTYFRKTNAPELRSVTLTGSQAPVSGGSSSSRPNTPTNVRVVPVSSSSVSVRWNYSGTSSVTFRIYRVPPVGEIRLVATSSAGSVTLDRASFQAGSTDCFIVVAVNSAGESSQSDSACG